MRISLTGSAEPVGPLLPDRDCRLCGAEAEDDPWVLAYDGDEPDRQGTREALLTLGNGYMATRGTRPERVADGVHYPGTYVAGVYNRLVSVLNDRSREDESLVNMPNWLPVAFRVPGGEWFGAGDEDLAHHHVALDLRRGVMRRETVVDQGGWRTRVRQRRLVSMAAPHLAALETVLIPENWSGRLEVRSCIDASVTNSNVADFAELASRHLEVSDSGDLPDGETVWLTAETTQSKIRVAQASRTSLRGLRATQLSRQLLTEGAVIGHDAVFEVEEGAEVTLDKVVAVYTSRDWAISEPLQAALEEVAHTSHFDAVLAAHESAWKLLWRRLYLGLDGDTPDQLAVNLHMFHVLQTLSSHTAELDVGVPARGLHGEGYRGHVFWDELFVFPLLNFRMPHLTRELLLYRHRRLPQARWLAADNGRQGAQFPWQSGSDGREETPAWFFNPKSARWMPDNSRRQYHVNLAIAYNVWQYWQVTSDTAFVTEYGAELLIEIARFWASSATYDPADDRFDIRRVMGPDEFHDGYPDRPGQGIDNNTYVNVMVSWVLSRALELPDVLGEQGCDELWERLGVSEDELAHWDHLSRRLRVRFLDNGLLAQFEGYQELKELNWRRYQDRYGNIGRLDLILEAEDDTTNRYKLSKQADVLMLFYLFTTEELTEQLDRLGYQFDPSTIPQTVDYYLARTSHGSTLSRVAHAWVLARSDRAQSWQALRDALQADISDTQGGTTREGIHLGAMAGTADILQRCYTGLEARSEVLWFAPQLPSELQALDLNLLYRDQWLTVHLDHKVIQVHAQSCAALPVRIGLDGDVYELAAGGTLELPLT